MKKLRMEIELEYDDDIMHADDKAWFEQFVLCGRGDDRLILHSNFIGDEVGTVTVLKIEYCTPRRNPMADASFSLNRLSRIKEVTDADVRFGVDRAMRVYSMSPEASVVQIRINGPITESGKGTARQMIATAVLDEGQLRILRDLLDQELLRLGDNRARDAA